MPYVVQYDVPGDERIYAQVKEAIGTDNPPGLQVHLVVTSPAGGLRHLEVWDTADEQEAFDRERVAPAVNQVLRSMGIDTVPPRPPRDVLHVVDLHVVR